MFVIGKSNKPHIFDGIKSTPCRYHAQKNIWIDSELFEVWVREQDRKFALEGRKVALVIENCTAHPNIESLKSITLNFLPINATSFAAYGSKSHSTIEVQVPHSRNQDDHKAIDSGK